LRFSGEVEVSDRKQPGVDEGIEGFFGTEELILVGEIDVVNGLSVSDKRRDDLVRALDLGGRERESRPGLGES